MEFKLYNREPKYKDIFNPQTGKAYGVVDGYKTNNIYAIRMIVEVIRNGNFDNAPQSMKKLVAQHAMPTMDPANSEDLIEKVLQFQKAWPEIKKHQEFKDGIEDVATVFKAINDTTYAAYVNKYAKCPTFPVYFDTHKFLDSILDKNGKLINPDSPTQLQQIEKYRKLTKDWINELDKYPETAINPPNAYSDAEQS